MRTKDVAVYLLRRIVSCKASISFLERKRQRKEDPMEKQELMQRIALVQVKLDAYQELLDLIGQE